MYLFYSALLAAAFVLALPYYLWKGRGTGKYLQSFRERMGRLPPALEAQQGRSIWVHAVSVGEVLAARTLLEPLKQRFPGHRVILSTTTVTGHAVARKSAGAVDGLFFAPFDWRGPVRRVLDALDPSLLILVETEIWPNLIHESRRRGTRIAVVNGRISPRSFARYRLVRLLLARVLSEVDLFLMQGESHAQRILALGAPPLRVQVTGNLKFDALGDVRPSDGLERLMAAGSDQSPLWIAGSTMRGEEEAVLKAFRQVKQQLPAARLLIAPRHSERFGEVPALIEAAGLGYVRRSALQPGAWADGQVLVLDTLGELAQVYPLATVVFVGGSLVAAGGHNILEAAVAGKAVVVGPHMENFQEIADEFEAEGAMVRIDSEARLAPEILSLLTDDERRRSIGERARALVTRNRGALQRTLDSLAGLVA